MIQGPLAERLEYAILEIVMQMNGEHQDHWGRWEHMVSARCGKRLIDPEELKNAFVGLHSTGIVELTKPDGMRRDAFRYSRDLAADEKYFFLGRFNVDITSKGRSYWAGIEQAGKTGRVGF